MTMSGFSIIDNKTKFTFMKTRILQLIMFVFVAVAGHAQITTSSMSGKIMDSNGEPLIGATVIAVHTPSGTEYGTITNVNGQYSIFNMRVGGPYKVTASYVGYDSQSREGSYLSLGSPGLVNFTLSESGILVDEVLIAASKDPNFDEGKTGSSVNINSEQINRLPTVSRSLNDFTSLTSKSNGTSFAGTNNRFNNYTID